MGVKFIFVAASLFSIPAKYATGGVFSRSAIPIWGSRSSFVAKSPDGTKAVVIRVNTTPYSDEPHRVSVEANGREYKTGIGYLVDSEIAWSPDSAAFFVTYSDGGLIGTYHVKVFSVGKSVLRESEPIPNGRRLLVPTCFDPERPNVVAVKWMEDSSRMLIAVQVPPHSSCASMGTFHAFEISIPDGTVLKRYGQLRAKALFARFLGPDLMGADDQCARKPETCVPPGLNSRADHRP